MSEPLPGYDGMKINGYFNIHVNREKRCLFANEEEHEAAEEEEDMCACACARACVRLCVSVLVPVCLHPACVRR